MTLILLDSERFATFWTPKRISAMRHQNTVLHQLLQYVPWAEFERLVEDYEADKHVRRLTTKSQFVAMAYAQLSGAAGLREIETGLQSCRARLYHLGAQPVRRATLSDANAQRPADVFSKLFSVMLRAAHRGLRRSLADAVYLIDSTGIKLNERSADWARFSAGVCGAKVHVAYDPDADCPMFAQVSAANVTDITVAQKMPIEPGATYVFDLGYYDYAWWAKLDNAGCRIVTRFKKNTPLRVIEECQIPEKSPVLSDRIGLLPARQTKSRRNPMGNPVREVRVATETGKILRILSNDLDLAAEQIAELYKRRWAIELFFRWVKQTLKIRHFVGTSENAVRIQIAIALIAFLLLRLAQQTQSAIDSSLRFARLIRIHLMGNKRLDRLLEPEPPPTHNPNQMALQWA
jgi:transposase